MRALIIVLILLAGPAQATDFAVVGDQLIVSGRASGNELARVRDAIAEHGDRIKTVILRDFSGRTDNDDLMRIAGLFADHGWRTAISGFCGTACAYLYLGGVQRHFTDDKPPGQTELMFGSTNQVADSQRIPGRYWKGDASSQGNYRFRNWVKARTNDRIGESTLDLLFRPDAEIRYLHFFDSTRLARKDGVSMLLCDGKESPRKRWQVCQKISGTDAYKEGIVTSSELIRSNDRPARAPITPGDSGPTLPVPEK